MKIILFSIFGAANDVLEALVNQGTPPSYVVPPNQSHYLRDDTIKLAHQYNIPVVMFNDHPHEETFVKRINELNPDLILVATFTHLIPKSIYSAASIAAINAHPSLLPDYRGANPYYHVIANGETQTGVSLHLLDEKFDTGDIIKQASITIDPKDTSGILTIKLNALMANELTDLVNIIHQSGLPALTKQPEKGCALAPRVDTPLENINWNDSAVNIDRMVRAANPFHHICSTLNDTKITVFSGRPIQDKFVHAISGEILPTPDNSNGILVQTGDGAYLISSLMFGLDWVGDAQSILDFDLAKVGNCFK